VRLFKFLTEVGNVFRAIPLAEYEAWKEGVKTRLISKLTRTVRS
jgi:hypothetical protein